MLDVVGNALIVAPEQNGPTGSKVGVVFGVIVIVKVAVVAHCPAVGVKVYVVDTELLIAGDHVPVILFVELVANGGIVAPLQ